MSTGIKFDIQMFGDGGSGNWTHGVSKSAIESALQKFHTQINETKETIMNTSAVRSSLTANWSGKDCETYLEKFDQNAKSICDQIDEYVTAIDAETTKLIASWEEFQAGHIG